MGFGKVPCDPTKKRPNVIRPMGAIVLIDRHRYLGISGH